MAETHRHHAAGHISAATLCIDVVAAFVDLPNVTAPPQVKEKIGEVRRGLALLEQWFVDPLNTTIERSGS